MYERSHSHRLRRASTTTARRGGGPPPPRPQSRYHYGSTDGLVSGTSGTVSPQQAWAQQQHHTQAHHQAHHPALTPVPIGSPLGPHQGHPPQNSGISGSRTPAPQQQRAYSPYVHFNTPPPPHAAAPQLPQQGPAARMPGPRAQAQPHHDIHQHSGIAATRHSGQQGFEPPQQATWR
jgi:hypothetical protein